MISCDLTPEVLAMADIVIFHTSHSSFDPLGWSSTAG
jgi:hypothetical protein